MVKLKFYFDFDKDLKLIKEWFPRVREVFGEDKFNWFFKLYYPKCVGKTNEEIIRYFQKNKRQIVKKTKISSKKLIKRWLQVENDFFNQIEKITGFKWKHKVYGCHLTSSFVCGGSYDEHNLKDVSVFPLLKHANPIETLFHELIHIHFWEVFEKLKIQYNKKQRLMSKGKFWDLSELEVNIPLSELKIRGYKYVPNSHVYLQHKELWKKIKPLWKGNFKEFILKALNVIK